MRSLSGVHSDAGRLRDLLPSRNTTARPALNARNLPPEHGVYVLQHGVVIVAEVHPEVERAGHLVQGAFGAGGVGPVERDG